MAENNYEGVRMGTLLDRLAAANRAVGDARSSPAQEQKDWYERYRETANRLRAEIDRRLALRKDSK